MESMAIEAVCRLCGTVRNLHVMEEDYNNWRAGQYAQNAFPYLTGDEREMLISKTCDACWHKIFGEWND